LQALSDFQQTCASHVSAIKMGTYFFTGAASVHWQTLPDTSFILNLKE
jgi:hypothetical protein